MALMRLGGTYAIIKRAFPTLTGTVADAIVEVTIKITASDCKLADPLDGSSCALARAIQRAFDTKDVLIFKDFAYVV